MFIFMEYIYIYSMKMNIVCRFKFLYSIILDHLCTFFFSLLDMSKRDN